MILDHFLYYLFVFIPVLGFVFSKPKNTKIINYAIVVITALFFCFSYMSGSDWRQYELTYQSTTLEDLYSIPVVGEPLFYYCIVLFKYLGADFWFFLIATKLFCFFTICYFINKYAQQKFLLGLSFFLSLSGIFLFIDNPLRNLIAISFYLIALDSFLNKKYYQYIIIGLIAILFHISAIAILLITPLISLKIKSRYLLIAYAFVFVLLMFSPEIVIEKIVDFLGANSVFEKKVYLYFILDNDDAIGKAFSLGALTKILTFLILINTRKYIEKKPFGSVIFMGAIMFLFIYRLGLSIPILGRYQLYFSVFYSVSVVLSISYFKRLGKTLYMSFLIITMAGSVNGIITSKPHFIPYSSYIPFLFVNDKPSYSYRSNYNYRLSPYPDN